METQFPQGKGAQQLQLSKFTGAGFGCVRVIRGPCLLWPNGWMDQGAVWYGGRPSTRSRCVRWGSSSPQRGTPPIFGPCLLWPNDRPSQLLLSTCVFFFCSCLGCFVFVLFAVVVLGLVYLILSQDIGWEERLLNDLFCVEWDEARPLVRVSAWCFLMVWWQEVYPSGENPFHRSPDVIFRKRWSRRILGGTG